MTATSEPWVFKDSKLDVVRPEDRWVFQPPNTGRDMAFIAYRSSGSYWEVEFYWFGTRTHARRVVFNNKGESVDFNDPIPLEDLWTWRRITRKLAA